MQNKEFSVLYTHQKTKKRKTWQDGILLFQKSNNKVILYDEQRSLLDSLFISSGQVSSGMDLESDRYLITVEDERTDSTYKQEVKTNLASQTTTSTRNYSLPSVRRKGFQPPKIISSEKRSHSGLPSGPPDKRFRPLNDDERDFRQIKTPRQRPSDSGIVTKDQFFSLYSQKRQQSLPQRNSYVNSPNSNLSAKAATNHVSVDSCDDIYSAKNISSSTVNHQSSSNHSFYHSTDFPNQYSGSTIENPVHGLSNGADSSSNNHAQSAFNESNTKNTTHSSNVSHIANSSNSQSTANAGLTGKRNSSQILALFSSNNSCSNFNPVQPKVGSVYSSNADCNQIKTLSRGMSSVTSRTHFGHVNEENVDLEERKNSPLFGTIGGVSELREGREQEIEKSTLFAVNNGVCEDKENEPDVSSMFRSKDPSAVQEGRSVGSSMYDRITSHFSDTMEDTYNFQKNSKPSLFGEIRDGSSSDGINKCSVGITSQSQILGDIADAKALFNKSKNSYNTTPYLETDNHFADTSSELDNSTTNSVFQTVFCDEGLGINGEGKSVMDLFEVPDVDMTSFNLSDELSDGVVSDFYQSADCPSVAEEKNSIHSEQEKSDQLTSWRGSLASNTVRRNYPIPVSRSQEASQSPFDSLSQRVPRIQRNRKRKPMTSGPQSIPASYPSPNNFTEQEAEVPNHLADKSPLTRAFPNQNDMVSEFSRKADGVGIQQEIPEEFSRQKLFTNKADGFQRQQERHGQFPRQNVFTRKSEGIIPQQSTSGGFSRQNVSTKKSDLIGIQDDFPINQSRHSSGLEANGLLQPKFTSQTRRIGLSKPGRVMTAGLMPANRSFIQRPMPGQRSGQPSLIQENSGVKDVNMTGELMFPTSKECDGNAKPSRQVTIPITFTSEQQYRHTMKTALREHLNIILFELAQSYHNGLRKVNITQYSTLEHVSHQEGKPKCAHGFATLRTVKKDGPNKGRLFYSCAGTSNSKCKLFKWADECKAQGAGTTKGQAQTNRPSLSSSGEITSYFKSQNISLYCDCQLVIKKKNPYGNKRFGKNQYRYSKRKLDNCDDLDTGKKVMYLELSRRESSTAYSKDDIWIISKTLTFDKLSTFIAKSVYYGPYSNGELEISAISGYAPSKWRSGDTVFALHGCNATNELICTENIDQNVNNTMPLLHRLLTKPDDSVEPTSRTTCQLASTFAPPTRTSTGSLDIPVDYAFGLAEDMIKEYHLNMDQAAALYDCAVMFTGDSNSVGASMDISLIHGVFGAGKSYLLAVMIVYLVKIFSTTDQKPKILVSSTTNVAVDRILLGLLDLGFEDFVRVGSVRKIAKRLLPYSIHGSGSSSEEIKELQAMLKDDLEPAERLVIKKSIEEQRKGGNKQKLAGVPVVGVTCAACVFPCLEKMKFHVLLLDECSQMTEPAALLPLARFCCHKLVLVGDPKQLSPTIQGSQPDHDAGLEQTMFDRLVKMGYKTTLLRTQYRCHPVISAVANRLFYNGRLKDGVSEEDRAPLVDFAAALCFCDVTGGKEKCGQDGSYYNEEEAKFIVFVIGCFLASGLEPSQIGVITLYKSQLRTISSILTQSHSASFKELKSVQISTVDAFQGGEKDVILLSCVRTDHVGFIDCDRRTNVALTRAKRHLLIVGNQRMLSSNKMWNSVIQHCREQSRGIVSARNFQQTWNGDQGDDKYSGVPDNKSTKEPDTVHDEDSLIGTDGNTKENNGFEDTEMILLQDKDDWNMDSFVEDGEVPSVDIRTSTMVAESNDRSDLPLEDNEGCLLATEGDEVSSVDKEVTKSTRKTENTELAEYEEKWSDSFIEDDMQHFLLYEDEVSSLDKDAKHAQNGHENTKIASSANEVESSDSFIDDEMENVLEDTDEPPSFGKYSKNITKMSGIVKMKKKKAIILSDSEDDELTNSFIDEAVEIAMRDLDNSPNFENDSSDEMKTNTGIKKTKQSTAESEEEKVDENSDAESVHFLSDTNERLSVGKQTKEVAKSTNYTSNQTEVIEDDTNDDSDVDDDFCQEVEDNNEHKKYDGNCTIRKSKDSHQSSGKFHNRQQIYHNKQHGASTKQMTKSNKTQEQINESPTNTCKQKDHTINTSPSIHSEEYSCQMIEPELVPIALESQTKSDQERPAQDGFKEMSFHRDKAKNSQEFPGLSDSDEDLPFFDIFS